MAAYARRGFNEAAGIPRGKLELMGVPRAARVASMRPRVFPAENAFDKALLGLATVLLQ